MNKIKKENFESRNIVKYDFINYLKVFAAFSVTAVHFRNRVETNIPEELVSNLSKLFFSVDYALFVSAVPIFLLVTGFVSEHKKPNKSSVLGLIKIYILYLFICFITYNLMVSFGIRERLSFLESLSKASRFDLIGAWYLEMYLGLALLAPYLNIMLNNLKREEHTKFILILVCVISIPAFVNRNPMLNQYFSLPNYWNAGYPIVYYSIGNYLRKYKLKIEDSIYILFLIAIGCFLIIVTLLYMFATTYTSTVDGYYPSIIQVILSSMIFLIFRNIKWKNRTVIEIISKYTLSIYLVAVPVDRILYPFFIEKAGSAYALIKYAPIVVLIAFLVAVVLGIILATIFGLTWNLLESKVRKVNKNRC